MENMNEGDVFDFMEDAPDGKEIPIVSCFAQKVDGDWILKIFYNNKEVRTPYSWSRTHLILLDMIRENLDFSVDGPDELIEDTLQFFLQTQIRGWTLRSGKLPPRTWSYKE